MSGGNRIPGYRTFTDPLEDKLIGQLDDLGIDVISLLTSVSEKAWLDGHEQGYEKGLRDGNG